ncbi:hypothetical protein D9M72_505570 [compost metagenome]
MAPGSTPAHERGWHAPGMLEVHVTPGADVDQTLDEAIAAIAESAEHHKTGVLVTRLDAGSYIVRAHPTVPHGLIRQQDG